MAWASRKESDRVGVGPVTEQVVDSNDPHGDHMNSGCSSRAFCGQVFVSIAIRSHTHVTTLRWRLSPYDGYDRLFEKMG
jgi:hypothetical protein